MTKGNVKTAVIPIIKTKLRVPSPSLPSNALSRIPTLLVEEARSYPQSTQRPTPRRRFNVFHYLIEVFELVLKDPI
jgi:hypothetical protein